jgi:hypothetical protein
MLYRWLFSHTNSTGTMLDMAEDSVSNKARIAKYPDCSDCGGTGIRCWTCDLPSPKCKCPVIAGYDCPSCLARSVTTVCQTDEGGEMLDRIVATLESRAEGVNTGGDIHVMQAVDKIIARETALEYTRGEKLGRKDTPRDIIELCDLHRAVVSGCQECHKINKPLG